MHDSHCFRKIGNSIYFPAISNSTEVIATIGSYIDLTLVLPSPCVVRVLVLSELLLGQVSFPKRYRYIRWASRQISERESYIG